MKTLDRASQRAIAGGSGAVLAFVAGNGLGPDIPEIVTQVNPSIVQVPAHKEGGKPRSGAEWFADISD
jgi:hypothetical protein